MRTVSTSPSLFRRLLIGLLLIAVLVKPVLAFDCEFAETLQQPTEQGVSPASADISVATGVDDCCPFQDCHDCCAHTTAMTPARISLAVVPRDATIPLTSIAPFQPRPLLAAFRPPIVR